MKKLMIACAFLASTSMVSLAQTTTKNSNAPIEKKAESRAKMYQSKLGLSQQQYDAVYKAELDYFKQDQTAKMHGGAGPGQAYQMQLGRDQQYKNALTAEQYAKYDASRPKPTMAMPGAPAEAAH